MFKNKEYYLYCNSGVWEPWLALCQGTCMHIVRGILYPLVYHGTIVQPTDQIWGLLAGWLHYFLLNLG